MHNFHLLHISGPFWSFLTGHGPLGTFSVQHFQALYLLLDARCHPDLAFDRFQRRASLQSEKFGLIRRSGGSEEECEIGERRAGNRLMFSWA